MDGARVTQQRATFSMTCTVEINIRADAASVWRLLTDAQGFPNWNSTVTRIEGNIKEGERLRIHVPGTSRTFTPKVSGFVPNQTMIWSDGFAPLFKGVRVFTLSPRDDGSTDFLMKERFSGLIFAMVKGSLPDFGPIFSRYANDLKTEAERTAR